MVIQHWKEIRNLSQYLKNKESNGQKIMLWMFLLNNYVQRQVKRFDRRTIRWPLIYIPAFVNV